MDRSPRVCTSSGHGLGSRHAGSVDPGATVVLGGTEADVVRTLAACLDHDYRVLFGKLPGSLSMFRDDGLYHRADDEAFAEPYRVDTFNELHLNATTPHPKRDGKEVGVEVLYEDTRDRAYATRMSRAIAEAAGLPNRGAYRSDMAVLSPKPGMAQLIIEVAFASDMDDMLAYRAHFTDIELAILNVNLDKWGMRRIYSGIPPRKWGAVRRAWYRRNRFRL